MAGPIYKLWMAKPKEAWFALTPEEQKAYIGKLMTARANVGGKEVITCDPSWSTNPWTVFGVDEYPDLDAALQIAKRLDELEYARYFEPVSMLGTRYGS
jgi:hypothetical protein